MELNNVESWLLSVLLLVMCFLIICTYSSLRKQLAELSQKQHPSQTHESTIDSEQEPTAELLKSEAHR